MVEDILFRGKEVNKNKWIFGSFIDSGNHSQVLIYPGCDYASTLSVGRLVYLESVTVEPDTVGRYTCLVDRAHTQIFENDLLCMQQTCRQIVTQEKCALSTTHKTTYIARVVFENGGFFVTDITGVKDRIFLFDFDGRDKETGRFGTAINTAYASTDSNELYTETETEIVKVIGNIYDDPDLLLKGASTNG